MLVTKTADLPSLAVSAGAETGKNKCHGWEKWNSETIKKQESNDFKYH